MSTPDCIVLVPPSSKEPFESPTVVVPPPEATATIVVPSTGMITPASDNVFLLITDFGARFISIHKLDVASHINVKDDLS